MHTNCPVGSPPRREQGCCADWLTAPLMPQIRPQPGVSESGPRLQLTILCPIKHAQCTLSVVSQSPSECLPAALLNSLSSAKYVLTGHVTWTLFPKSIFMADILFPRVIAVDQLAGRACWHVILVPPRSSHGPEKTLNLAIRAIWGRWLTKLAHPPNNKWLNS
jgi:hypothetical protein